MVSGWTGPLLAALALWILVAIGCLPLLGLSRLRGLVSDWPTDGIAVNYPAVCALVTVGHAATFVVGVAALGGLEGTDAIRWTFGVAIGYPLALWLLVGIAWWATGRWSPGADGFGRWLLVGVAGGCYAVVVAVAAAVGFFLLFVFYFPG